MSDSQFTFTTHTTDSTDLKVSVLQSGKIRVTLSDEDMERIQDLAEKRAQSYVEGRTRDDAAGRHDSVSTHVQGLRAEVAAAYALGDGWDDVDKSISDSGDGGVDLVAELDGEVREIDVKSSHYSPAYIMKKASARQFAEAYVMAYDDDSDEILLTGWCTRDELVQEENKTPARGGSWTNYELKSYNSFDETV